MEQVIAILGMFASILVILRWFKQDTTEMIKIYAEATDKRMQAVEKTLEAIKQEIKDFHDRLCEIERNRNK